MTSVTMTPYVNNNNVRKIPFTIENASHAINTVLESIECPQLHEKAEELAKTSQTEQMNQHPSAVETLLWADFTSSQAKKIAAVACFYIGKSCFETFNFNQENRHGFQSILKTSFHGRLKDRNQKITGRGRLTEVKRKELNRSAGKYADYTIFTVSNFVR